MSKLKVAILEDNKTILNFLKSIIEENNLAIIVAAESNSSKFIDIVKLKLPDALLLDIDLENDGMNGIEVANELKLPVMFVSGHNDKHLKEIERLKRDFDFTVDHFTKPVYEKDFIKTATRFLKEVNEHLNAEFIYLDFKDNKRNKIAIETIVYLCADKENGSASNNKFIYFTDRKPETLIDFSFSKMEKLGFNKNKFLTVHRSYVVNEKHIISYKKSSHEIEVEFLDSSGESKRKFIKVSENFKMK